MKVHLLLIDFQVDFCDPKKGKLYVPGAEKDVERVAAMIRRIGKKITDIHATQDSHSVYDIAHPIYWVDSNGNHPAPFTVITADDVRSGRWLPIDKRRIQACIDYLDALKAKGKYDHRIWPEHCLIASDGHAFMEPLQSTLIDWARENVAIVDVVTKGSNVHTEHFSGLEAEVPDPADPSTQLNTRLVQIFQDADLIAIAGEAGSHCVRASVLDLANTFGDQNIKKLRILTDAMSPVAGLEFLQEDFLKEIVARGAQLTTTVDFLS